MLSPLIQNSKQVISSRTVFCGHHVFVSSLEESRKPELSQSPRKTFKFVAIWAPLVPSRRIIYTAEKFGSGPVKKAVRTHNFCKEILEASMVLRKLQYFFTQVMGPYRFFDGSRPKCFCSVNAPSFSSQLVSIRKERKGKELYLSVLSSSVDALIGDTVN